MHWPQYTLLGLWALSLGVQLAKHGQPEKGNHNFFVSLFATLLTGSLLWFGDFFK